mgnify:CR=1 FL=1
MAYKNILKRRWIKNNTRKQPWLAGSDVLLWLLQGEKAFGMIDGLNKYCFFVPMNVNKIDIAKGFEQLYGKVPTSVNTIVLPSKSGSIRVKRKSFKKAIITLAKDDKIDVI